MTAPLRRVLVRPPRAENLAAWRDYGWRGEPDAAGIVREHEAFCELLGSAGAEVKGKILRRAPLAGAHVGVALLHLLEEREHEGHGGFSHSEAVGFCRRVTHHDAELGGGVGVDIVDADAVFCDDAQPLGGLHHAPADRR